MPKKIHKIIRGHSIVEALVAIGIFIIMISASVILFFSGQSSTQDSLQTQYAENLTRTAIEATRSIAEKDYEEVEIGIHGVAFESGAWRFAGTSTTTDIYTTTVTVTQVAPDIRKITTDTTWSGSHNRIQKISLSQYITNWKQVRNDLPEPSGDWMNPRSLGSADTESATAGTDVDMEHDFAYVATNSSNAAKSDLHIFNMSNPGSDDAGSVGDINVLGARGISSLDYGTNDILYAALNNGTADLAVISVTNKQSPQVIGSAEFTTAETVSLMHQGDTVYIGTKNNSSGAELFALSVSDPANPTVTASYEIGADVLDIDIHLTRAYIATNKTNNGLMLFDIATPSTLTYLGSPVTSTVESVYVRNFAATFVGSGTQMRIYDTTEPTAGVMRGTYNTGSSINDILAIGYLAFLATNNSNQEFQVINITNLTSPVFHSSFNYPQSAAAIDYNNNLIFTAVRSNDALRILTSSP